MQSFWIDSTSRSPIDNLFYYHTQRDDGYSFQLKSGATGHKIIYVCGGNLEFYFYTNRSVVRLNTGDVVFIPMQTPYKVTYYGKDASCKILQFSIATDASLNFLSKPVIKKSNKFSSVFDSISFINMRDMFFLYSKAYELIYLFNKEEATVPAKYQKILPALEDIQTNYCENQKVAYYAQMCNMSEPNFRRLFREYTGKSFIKYRNNIRLDEARKLISSGECTVAQAAYITGFNNMSYFYEIFGRK